METRELLRLNAANFDQATAQGVTLVDFWAPWCGPCRMQLPIIEELAGEVGPGVQIAKVNVDESPMLAARFRVQSIPLLVVLKDGREVTRLVGMQSKQTLHNAVRSAG